MGEVYRARDTRLGRDVAVKVLPSSFATDRDRLRRFEQEARIIGSLNHPNILAVYDIGTINGSPYLVAELLEGKTLRDHMEGSVLAHRKAIDYGRQIASGLAAAHEKGIVHRDLKPENIFVLRDGRVKIMDFGLAKVAENEAANKETTTRGDSQTEDHPSTSPGTVLGTMGYMSPEQVMGNAADHRSDIFSFGAVIYEMLSGRRAFKRASNAEIMSAILKEDPPELDESTHDVSPGLARVVRHCLEKSPEERFQSASDIAFDLELLSHQRSATSKAVVLKEPSKRRWAFGLIAALMTLLAGVAVFRAGRQSAKPTSPHFRQLTFQRGTIFSAKFAPDGQSVFYTAAWSGATKSNLYTTRRDAMISRTMNIPDAQVLDISSKGTLALRFGTGDAMTTGMLATLPMTGGTPRELLGDTLHAAWSPHDEALAVVRLTDNECRLEYPIGRVLLANKIGWFTQPRFSPDGKRIAYFEHSVYGDTRGYVAITDMQGKASRLTREWNDVNGLDWAVDGKEIWFTAAETGVISKLYAVSLDGEVRELLQVPGRVKLMDVSAEGKVLLSDETVRTEAYGRGAFSNKEINLSWFDWTLARDISSDGKWALLEEGGEGGGPEYSILLRKMDGSEPIRLGSGLPSGISPDGKWVISSSIKQPSSTVLLPTGAGQNVILGDSELDHGGGGRFLPNGKAIVILAAEARQDISTYLVPVDGSSPKRVGPPGFLWRAISPDSSRIAGVWLERSIILPIGSSSTPEDIPGVQPADRIVQWSADGHFLYTTRTSATSASVFRLNIKTGARTQMFKVTPADASGLVAVDGVLVSPNGRYYVVTARRVLSDLYQVENLK
jgi:eukaryotic-like serine/threonine-protein kinase